MSWRTVVISNPARLSCRSRQLVCESKDEEEVTLPAEDIAALLIESAQVTVTVPALRILAENQVTVIVCDETFHPCGALFPLGGHYKAAGILEDQIRVAAAFKKRCWQAIVRRKIKNQAQILEKLGRQDSAYLTALLSKVESGDPKNCEGTAARKYWPALFSSDFKRGADTQVNGALNYGYSVVRAAVARGLVARGLTPSLGVHHRGELNNFNLADDFIEPFRPFVDFHVAQVMSTPNLEFGVEQRRRLIGILQEQVEMPGGAVTLVRAAELIATSYVSALQNKNPKLLELPALLL